MQLLVTVILTLWVSWARGQEHCDMPIFENATAIITGKPVRPDDMLGYQCLDGYENRDGSKKGAMVCESSEKCGPPPGISNGDITSVTLKVYYPWSTVKYQCQTYYQIQGPKYVTCSYGKWSEVPRCMDPCVLSEKIMKEKNIEINGKYDKSYFIKSGTSIDFKCKSGRSNYVITYTCTKTIILHRPGIRLLANRAINSKGGNGVAFCLLNQMYNRQTKHILQKSLNSDIYRVTSVN
ncbi:Complement factor H-related protein 4 [Myotis davidii]|uniref:Complement factor H-related protein 4 n=1 Tax=Myotis davidii TaxID=225400 RepID=L5LFC5_MYODS|nr:Complement factor H-related protein 4 [Myotis davidii]